jgi:hypothetical protein
VTGVPCLEVRWREAASKVENRGTGFPAPRCEGPYSQSVSSQREAKVGPKAVVRNVFAACNRSENASNFESLQPLRSNFDWIFYSSPLTLLPSGEAVLQPPQWRLQLNADHRCSIARGIFRRLQWHFSFSQALCSNDDRNWQCKISIQRTEESRADWRSSCS